MNMMSEQTDQLFTALAKAQGKFTVAEFNRTNPHFKSKFADLQSYFSACRGPLSENGLSVSQLISEQEGRAILITILAHASGQWIKSVMPINPTKNDMQGLGSALSYAKRYSLGAIIGLASGEEDDDGNEAVEEPKAKPIAKPVQPNYLPPPAETKDCITPEQLAELRKYWELCSTDHRNTRSKILRHPPHYCKSLEELPKNIYQVELELAKLNAKVNTERDGGQTQNNANE
jgi:ERF superfamily protein